MGKFAEAKALIVTGLCLFGRMGYAAGQTYFSIKSANDYLRISDRPISTASNVTAVMGTVISTAIGKTPAAWRQFGADKKTEEKRPVEATKLGWFAWMFKKTIDGSGLIYGLTNSVSGYFGTLVLGKDMGADSTAWKATSQGAGIYVAVTQMASYYSYDYKLIQENSELMARAIDERNFIWNKAMASTVVTGVAIIPAYVGQAYFWTKPSIDSIPYADALLGTTGMNIAAATACVTTFFTAIGWLPSMYNYFTQKQREEHASENGVIPTTSLSTMLKIAAYVSGTIDSLGGNGLGPFIGVIVTLNQMFGLNPYGWMAGYAAFCGVNAAIVNMMFSVYPGLDDALKTIYHKKNKWQRLVINDDSETQPLLADGNKSQSYNVDIPPSQRVYTQETAKSSSPLLFKSTPPMDIPKVSPDKKKLLTV